MYKVLLRHIKVVKINWFKNPLIMFLKVFFYLNKLATDNIQLQFSVH